jgi:hypothetical protein
MHGVGTVLLAAHVDVSTTLFHNEQTQCCKGDEGQENFPHDVHPKK